MSVNVKLRPAGYEALLKRYRVEVIPNWHKSFISTGGTHRIDSTDGIIEEVYPATHFSGEQLGEQLEFAIKYDGINLAILATLFQVVNDTELVQYIKSKPTGKFARRLWFLYEFLLGRTLPLDDLSQGNYVDLLETSEYYTSTESQQIRRHRINNNLLGNNAFCPTVRKTDELRKFESANLPLRSRKIIEGYSPELLKRALSYLYTKETKSSFEIEHIKPNSSRAERFIALLETAEHDEFVDKPKLIDLQNRIVDSRFRDSDYRTNQNYVGETIAWQNERIHFVCPKPEDMQSLMTGLITAHRRMESSRVSEVVHAAAIAYGFVFLHPFEDGNGRIHRFLIHNILARRGFTPKGLMFPVSAGMLKNPSEYNASLEAFSRPLMPLVDYTLDAEGRMTVHNETAHWYKYIDMTPQTEALYRFIEKTIDTELRTELEFLANYDRTKRAIQEIIDMPDRQIDLFIKICLQNNGVLSERKRASQFAALSDDEITRMEQAIRNAYGNTPPAE